MPNNQTNEQMAAYLDDMATRYTEYAASRLLAGAAALRRVDTLETAFRNARNVSCAYCGHKTMAGDLTEEQIDEQIKSHMIECEKRPEAGMLLVIMAVANALDVSFDGLPKNDPVALADRLIERIDILSSQVQHLVGQVDALAAEGARLRENVGTLQRSFMELLDGLEYEFGVVAKTKKLPVGNELDPYFAKVKLAIAAVPGVDRIPLPATAAWLQAHDAEVRRAVLEEAAQMADHRECHAEYHQTAAAYRLLAKQIREWAAQPAKEGA